MASYGKLLRIIPTSEINRLMRENNYSRWAYFVDPAADKVGVIFANDTMFGAYKVADVPDPKLEIYGLEQIKDLKLTPDKQLLILTAGDNEMRAAVFSNPMAVFEDEFSADFDYSLAGDWEVFLEKRQAQIYREDNSLNYRWLLIGGIIVLLGFFLYVALAG